MDPHHFPDATVYSCVLRIRIHLVGDGHIRRRWIYSLWPNFAVDSYLKVLYNRQVGELGVGHTRRQVYSTVVIIFGGFLGVGLTRRCHFQRLPHSAGDITAAVSGVSSPLIPLTESLIAEKRRYKYKR